MRRISALLAIAAVLVTVTTACGSAPSGAPADAAVVRIGEKDFRIDVRPRQIRAGEVELVVRNTGPVDHELIVVHAQRGTLPLRKDGLTVDEDALLSRQVTTLEPALPGTVRRVRLRLAPGRYEVFCNMAGHFMGGMHAFINAV